MASQTSLFPTREQRLQTTARMAALLTDALDHGAPDSVTPTIDITEFRRELAAKSFDEPEALNGLIEWTIDALKVGLVQMTHPRYFGLFNPAPSFAAECADQIAAAFNPQICVWSHAPVAVEIEAHVIAMLARRLGLPRKSGGHFTSGGSEANHTAVICALTAVEADFAEVGARAFAGQPRLYVSAESHLAWLKIAHQTGIGRGAVRLVATDGMGRMNPSALKKVVEQDQGHGDIPVLIAATAGTTNAGMIDPLHACADLADHHSVWFHVDAAWGGAVIASPTYQPILDGIERADSVTIDAHKWFATTMGAGMFITRRKGVLNESFRVAATYMPSNDVEIDPYVNSMQWSRRFIGLRLFLSLASVGWDGYAAHIEHSIDLIDHLTKRMIAKGWTLANDSRMAVACLIPPEGSESVEDCVSRVVGSGDSWVSVAQFEGQAVVRVCVTNGRTTVEDVNRLVRALCNEVTTRQRD